MTDNFTGVFLDLESADRGDLDLTRLKDCFSVFTPYPHTAASEVAQRIGHADVVISNKTFIGRPHLAEAKRLKIICIAATGTNNVDLQAAQEAGVVVCNVRDYATASVVQHVFALILSLTTHLQEYHAAVNNGSWSKSRHFCSLEYPIRELAGKTLGIIGYGVLGRAVAEVGKAFGMEIQVAQGTSQDHDRVSLDKLLASSDAISLHCPLTPQTRNMIAAPQLAAMRRDALLINTARGGLVDEQALADALRTGTIGGAGFDVLSEEPPPKDHILLSNDIPNLILTPHTAWASKESRQRMVDELVLNINAWQADSIRNQVV